MTCEQSGQAAGLGAAPAALGRKSEIGDVTAGRRDAVAVAGRVVGASLDAKQHTRLVDEFIDSVGAGSGKGGKRR